MQYRIKFVLRDASISSFDEKYSLKKIPSKYCGFFFGKIPVKISRDQYLSRLICFKQTENLPSEEYDIES